MQFRNRLGFILFAGFPKLYCLKRYININTQRITGPKDLYHRHWLRLWCDKVNAGKTKLELTNENSNM